MNTPPHRLTINPVIEKPLMNQVTSPQVAILLCTYNGAKYLNEQLDSFIAQTHENWVVYASDDGSTDNTVPLLKEFQQRVGQDRVIILQGPRKGFASNFLSLVKNQSINADYYAFSDQDDIWFADKLQRSVSEAAGFTQVPALYCSRTRLISADKQVQGYSPLFSAIPDFANALVQSLAGANTMLINAPARDLIAQTPADAQIAAHDWLTYLLVTGCGGTVIYDPLPTLDYRQHSGNLIGANNGVQDRLQRLVKMCNGRFREWSNQNLIILSSFREKLTPRNALIVERFTQARESSFVFRLYLMKKSGIYRQSLSGNISLFIAACVNRI